MAAKKKPPKTTSEPETRAFQNGKNALGAANIKRGFALTPEWDLWFALAHPDVSFITRDPPEHAEVDAEGWAEMCEAQPEPVIPRGVAVRRLRLQRCKSVRDASGALTDEARSALLDPSALDLDEATEIIRSHFENREPAFNPAAWFEALFGPDALLDVIVPILEKLSDADLAAPLYNDPEGYYAGWLAPLLRRSDAKTGQAHLERLRALLERSPRSARADTWSFAHMLGLAVGGAAFVREFAYRVDDRVDELSLLWADDDPDFVRSQLAGVSPGPPLRNPLT